ncbi:transporter substrate-binding domain-containing protein [Microbulbifer yueqingensis]|uniref:Membrane-bound lytic murein transglycosylase F n=1 Tax=Microbulbifer yueqingensis TaxID=658219 RepID=A0A1G8VXU1_9GAMM|nr:transporter substrate-binding domain-containing protein [Microbulbifer yueqingensis]SDJ70623.1 membrane-bound lytic murein transglycosylase F [Microbulbifer yueqingensis]
MMPSRRLPLLWYPALLLALVSGCERQSGDQGAPQEKPRAAAESKQPPDRGNLAAIPIELYDNYTETGDLDAVEKRGKLRLLVDPSHSAAIHRETTQQDVEIDQARLMARQLGLELVVLEVPQFADLIPMLNSGQGDLIASNLLVTSDAERAVDFSTPTAETVVLLVSAQDTEDVGDQSDLSGKTLVVTAGTEFERIAREFAAKHPGLELKVRDDNHIDLLVDVAIGRADFTIVDSQALELVLQFRKGLKANFQFPGAHKTAWAVRKQSPRLLQAINAQVRQLQRPGPEQLARGDLDAILQRGVLRAATRNHPGSYYMWKGEIRGFEYNLLENYARKLGVQLEITIARTDEDFVRLLREGEVDVCACLMAVTPAHGAAGVAFSDPYLESPTGIVARRGDKVKSLGDLSGRTLCVRRASSQLGLAHELQREVDKLELREVGAELDIREVIGLVAGNECDLTIADELSVQVEQASREEVTLALHLQRGKRRYAWLVREENPKLLQSINEFFASPSTDETLQELYQRYFGSQRQAWQKSGRWEKTVKSSRSLGPQHMRQATPDSMPPQLP